METDPIITSPDSYYYQKLALYGQDHYQFKECKYCKKPYFCGLKSCAEEIARREAQEGMKPIEEKKEEAKQIGLQVEEVK